MGTQNDYAPLSRGEGWSLIGRDPCAGEPGIVLPPGLLQPFLLRFRREDLHIMAFFSGHPDYEAVEAMIRYRGDGTPSIRAILTRHDQSQIDHVNDDDLSAEGHGVARQTCRRDIALAIDLCRESGTHGWNLTRMRARRWCSTSRRLASRIPIAAGSPILATTRPTAACR